MIREWNETTARHDGEAAMLKLRPMHIVRIVNRWSLLPSKQTVERR